MRVCEVCSTALPPERLAILPDTRVCVSCTTVKKRRGTMVPSNGKCGMTLQQVDGDDKQGLELLRKQIQRHRWNG